MTPWQYTLDSLRHFWRVHLAVAAGVATAAAVITGALVVGDSVRDSLGELASGGLERVDAVLSASHPFRVQLADEWGAQPELASRFEPPVPLLTTRGTLTYRRDGRLSRANGLAVWGAPASFWSLATQSDSASIPALAGLARNQLALTASVARELGVGLGDQVLLRVPLVTQVPADSTLGEKEETSASRRYEVAAILTPDPSSARRGDAWARFDRQPNQRAPRNIYLALESLQSLLDLPKQANAIALAPLRQTATAEGLSPPAAQQLQSRLQPQLVDLGISLQEVNPTGRPADRVWQVATDQLVLPRAMVPMVYAAFGDPQDGGSSGVQETVSYLANTLTAGDRKIPYSTVVGVDSTASMGPLLDAEGQPIELADDELVLNDWAAGQLQVQPGDTVAMRYYLPETTHGTLVESAPVELKLRAVVPLADSAGQPTRAADPLLTPELPGVTDQQTIRDWKLPFELVEEIRDVDETYWDDHRTTPKAFVSLALAKRLWQTRWGTVSAMRLSPQATANRSADQLAAQLLDHIDPASLGWQLAPVRNQALVAARGTTGFDGLFLGFSFFLLASAILLVALLFRLGVAQRGREIGLLLATGSAQRRVKWLLMREAAVVAATGVLVGVAAGVGYARLMIYGLNHWWVEATVAPFLALHYRTASLVAGGGIGLVVAMLTIERSLQGLFGTSVRSLLAGETQPITTRRRQYSRYPTWTLSLGGVAVVALTTYAWTAQGEAQAGAFLGTGALLLVILLRWVHTAWLQPQPPRDSHVPVRFTLAGLAARSARRNPARTTLTLSLAATASFLIVALGAFRLAPSESGVGGFDLIATSDIPIHRNLADPATRQTLGLAPEVAALLTGGDVVGLRMNAGEDASCLNLYQTAQPRVLGVPDDFAARSEFAWAGHDTTADPPPDEPADPWRLLSEDLGTDAQRRRIVPVILDRNTAYYSLKLGGVGARFEIRDARDQPLTLQVVGMLANSVLQGDVLMGEANFLQAFPTAAGERFFLIRLGAARATDRAAAAATVGAALESALEDQGFDTLDARERLAELFAVQNTYLSTFQSLGGLGLLLGAVGLAVAQLRSILERRGELALLRAVGFRARRLAWLILTENATLLVGGLLIGSLAAVATTFGQALASRAAVPWSTLAMLVAATAGTGLLASFGAIRAAIRTPLVAALRGD
jgi:ABC-type lipoprotein release transport system permease subunit